MHEGYIPYDYHRKNARKQDIGQIRMGLLYDLTEQEIGRGPKNKDLIVEYRWHMRGSPLGWIMRPLLGDKNTLHVKLRDYTPWSSGKTGQKSQNRTMHRATPSWRANVRSKDFVRVYDIADPVPMQDAKLYIEEIG